MDYLTTYTSLTSIRCGFAPGVVNYKKGALDTHDIAKYDWYIACQYIAHIAFTLGAVVIVIVL